MASIGSFLKLYRAKFDFSQGDFARILGISSNFLSQVENDKKKISLSKMEEIASILGFSKELLLLVASNAPAEMSEEQKKSFLAMQDSLIQYMLFKK